MGRKRILLLTLGLALYPWFLTGVPDTPLWFDEVFTANLVSFRKQPLDIIRFLPPHDPHPPLFYLYAWVWIRVVGLHGASLDPENLPLVGWWGRVQALTTAYVLTLPLLFTSPPAFFLLWSSDHWLEKVYEWRMYGLLGGLWFLLLFFLWRKNPWGVGITLSLSLYTHYLSLLWVPPILLWILLFWKNFLPIALPIVFYLPWGLVLLVQVLHLGTNAAIRPNPLVAGDALVQLGPPGGGVILLVLTLLGVWYSTRGRDYPRTTLLLIPLLVPLLWWVSSYALNITSPRYFGAFLPPLAYALALSLEGFAPVVARRPWKWGLFTLLGGLIGAGAWLALHFGPIRPHSVQAYDEGYRNLKALTEALDRKYGPGTIWADERGRAISLRFYYRGETKINTYPTRDRVEEVLAEEADKGWYGLLLWGPKAYREEVLASEAFYRAFTQRGCRQVAHLKGSISLLAFRCPPLLGAQGVDDGHYGHKHGHHDKPHDPPKKDDQ